VNVMKEGVTVLYFRVVGDHECSCIWGTLSTVSRDRKCANPTLCVM